MQKTQSGRNLYGSGHPNVSKIVESQTSVNISSTLIVNELIVNNVISFPKNQKKQNRQCNQFMLVLLRNTSILERKRTF